jgi:hypothetical protein
LETWKNRNWDRAWRAQAVNAGADALLASPGGRSSAIRRVRDASLPSSVTLNHLDLPHMTRRTFSATALKTDRQCSDIALR